MKKDIIFRQVISIIADQFGWDEDRINEETEFIYDLTADEADLGNLALSIEELFNVDAFEGILRLVTVRDLLDYIEDNMY
jgi:acyl carrier protein